MTLAELEQRLGALEQTVDSLKSRIAGSASSGRWWVDHAGRFKDDPLFDAIVRLGQTDRRSLRPKKAKRQKRSV